jgi:arylsulfatase
LLGERESSNREHLITFIGSRLAAVRWRQFRIHLMNVHLTDNNPSLGGYMGYRNETSGYPMIFNIESDPREMRNIAMENTWVVRPMTRIIGEYMATLKDHPNPPAANMTVF